jgi:uroporphyrinogen-III decarboxylase
MQNLMVDYYMHPEEVHRLLSALCDLYCRSIEHATKLLQPDGFWGSDDLGHQTQAMMRAETFDEFLKPYYVRLGKALKRNHLHFWLHSCGNNTPLLPSLIDAGVDMFHPVQKHTMDERAIARAYGDRLGFWSGFDVQHTLREASPDDVRAEVRFLVDTFDQAGGGMAIAAGNGNVAGTPFENIDAFLSEAVQYGEKHRRQFSH